MLRFFISLMIVCFSATLWADRYSDQIYSKIKDICHPTINDYIIIQKYLSNGNRPFIDRLDQWQYKNKALEFRFIGRNPNETIEYGTIPVNCDENDKERCILLYCSFNYEYPKVLKKLIERIKNSDFKGHILYRIGGWPDLEGGSLMFAHIPFAFKICFFREAQRLGYKSALWLDAAIVPLCSLNNAFNIIQEKGYFTFKTDFNMRDYCNKEACAAMGIDFAVAHLIPACLAGIIGFDFQNNAAQKALDRWYDITKNHEEAYFSPRQELCVISIILDQFNLKDNRHFNGKIIWDRAEINNPGVEFFVDKHAVQPNWPH